MVLSAIADASTASPNTLAHSSNGLFVVIIIEPFSYLSLIISKKTHLMAFARWVFPTPGFPINTMFFFSLM